MRLIGLVHCTSALATLVCTASYQGTQSPRVKVTVRYKSWEVMVVATTTYAKMFLIHRNVGSLSSSLACHFYLFHVSSVEALHIDATS